MRLLITEPMRIVADLPVASVRAEDESGCFAILPGHTGLLTRLVDSIVSWKELSGKLGFCAVRGGILTVTEGREVAIATREGHLGDDLDTLEQVIVAEFKESDEAERQSRIAAAKVRMRAIRQMVMALRGDGMPSEPRP
ncbi:MAG: F0F1 ATP synthase subunit epsilon [Candidatus Sphingomonas colombiensis]|nr:F0F1 ATP synthase subunit epsilon [Sphingomonas sp.]WEK43234.1 MAG: F0F1 ATP synthase subunit epsilon [Sphingomonas sp.]